MAGDSLHLLQIDLPIAFILVSPWLLIASARRNRNAPLVIPAVILFVLGLSSLYALVGSPSLVDALQNPRPGSELLRHQHDLMAWSFSSLAAATLLFVAALLFWDVLTAAPRRNRLAVVYTVFAAVYGACTMWLLIAAHREGSMATHISRHANP